MVKLIYHLVVATSAPELERRVNRLLSEGWTLQGGLAIGLPSSVRVDIAPGGLQENALIFAQAVIK